MALVRWLLREAAENEEEGLMNASSSVHGGQEARRECWCCYDEKNADINHLLEVHYEDRRAERTVPDGDPKRETTGPRNSNAIHWPLGPIVSAPFPVTPYMNSPLSLPLSRHAAFASYLFFSFYRSIVDIVILFVPTLLYNLPFQGTVSLKFSSSIPLLLHQHTSSLFAFLSTTKTNNLSLQATDSYHSLSLNIPPVDS
jgi:hypothetical protein